MEEEAGLASRVHLRGVTMGCGDLLTVASQGVAVSEGACRPDLFFVTGRGAVLLPSIRQIGDWEWLATPRGKWCLGRVFRKSGLAAVNI